MKKPIEDPDERRRAFEEAKKAFEEFELYFKQRNNSKGPKPRKKWGKPK